MMWMLRAPWLVVAYDLPEYRYMGVVTGNSFSLFCSKWRAVLNMFVRLFRIKLSESLKFYQKLFTKTKIGETDTNRAIDYLRMPKLPKSSKQLPSRVCHRYERLAVLWNVFAIILLCARKDVEKLFEENFSMKLCTSKIKRKKKEADTKSSVWDLKNANYINWHKSSNSQTVRGR